MLPYERDKMPECWIFQQNNDPKHTATRKKKLFSENGITVLDWPFQSPDLNSIENLWYQIKIKLCNKIIRKLDELYDANIQEWNAIPLAKLSNLMNSMERLCQEL